MVELKSGKETSENKQEESRLREEQVREQRHRERDIEKVYEEHLTEEHEVKMRILKRKEQLLDLKLQLLRGNLTLTSSLEPMQILP